MSLIALVALAGQASAQLTPDWDARHKGVDGFFFGFQVPVGMVTDSEGAVYVNSTVGPGLHTRDILTVKYAPDGTELWSVAYDGPSSDIDIGRGITIDSAGDILVLGQSECEFLVIKYDTSDGSVIWTSSHDSGNCPQRAQTFTTDDAGNIYVTGYTWPPGTQHQKDYYTYKLDSAGNVLWTATYAGPGPSMFADDDAVDIALDSSGDVLVTGTSNKANGQANFVTIKYDGNSGAQVWLSRMNLDDMEAVAMMISPEDDVYVTGAKVNGSTPFVTAKFDGTDGSEMWRSVNHMGYFGRVFGMALDSGGDIYVTGRLDPDGNKSNFNEDVVIMRLRASIGVRKWLTLYGENGNGKWDEGRAVTIDAQENVFVTGATDWLGSGGSLLLQCDAGNGQVVDKGVFQLPTEGTLGQVMGLDSAQNIFVAGTTRHMTGGNMDILTLKYPSHVAIGTNYCGPANLNSSGERGVISGQGSLDVPDNFLELTGDQLPFNKFAMFVVSQSQGFSTPPNSQGNLCLSGNIGRFKAQLGNTGNAGIFTISVDLTNIPVNPPVPVLPGETWNFQLWFRDNNPGTTSNFTDGLSITFN